MTVSELLLARHGEAHSNLDGTMTGPACAGLTDLGLTQAARLGERLRAEAAHRGRLEAIYTSTTRRAIETADLVANILGTEAREEHDLRVPDPGPHAEGKPWPYIRSTASPDPANPDRPLSPGGEGWASYLARAHAALTRILDRHHGRVLIVGHTETLKAAYSLFLGVVDLHRMKFDYSHAGVTSWRPAREWPGATTAHRRWALAYHNNTAHVSTDEQRLTLLIAGIDR